VVVVIMVVRMKDSVEAAAEEEGVEEGVAGTFDS
jgi:hypothetical protein